MKYSHHKSINQLLHIDWIVIIMLVVRVKRSRNDEPAEQLCIYEDDNYQPSAKKKRNLTSSLADRLALNDASNSSSPSAVPSSEVQNEALRSKNRIILQRVSTIDTFSKASIDSDTVKALHDRDSNTHESLQPPTKRTKLIVTQGKKSMPIVGKESCIVVDMTQIFQQPANAANATSGSAGTGPTAATNTASPAKSKVLDPATRLLGQGILVAIQKGNFDDLSRALIQGADAKYQLEAEKGGYTALMAACMKMNLRMVKRIMGYEPSVLAKNKDGLMAIEMIKETPFLQADAREIRELLQKAMIREHQALLRKEKNESEGETKAVNNDDYVVDIYCIKTTMMGEDDSVPAPASEQVASEDNAAPTEEEMHDIPASIVRVEGLKIMEDGQVEILSYDSDWSDLADDEDPDSNDERHFANDYPDESDDDNGGGLFRDNDYDDDNSDTEGGGGGYARSHYRNKQVSFRKQQKEEEADIDADLNQAMEDGQKGVPLFDRSQGIGRVLRSRPMDGSDPVTHGHDGESLRELWGQDQEVDFEDGEGNMPARERIHLMRMRTGMAFASNPREFNDRGLPKYGMELSDDEMDRMAMDDYGHRPGRDTYAYDPDLDESEEEDEEDD